MAILRCKMCGGTMEILEGTTVAQCEYCGTKQTVPNLSDERKAELFDRANHFRLNNDYDRALRIYEQILRSDETDADVYWSILLCRYGVEYVEDPATGKRIPTVNRTQRTSIFNDPDYQMTIKCADGYQREIYESEAKKIDDIQKGILAVSSQEEPFDVFICYKESGDDGRRTKDSVLAFDIYKQLTNEGYQVFFSRVTLEDKLGTAYEPYIFAALNSAKVMIVVGCKPEHFNAVWVKNEWSRFLALINAGEKKVIIPAYSDMSPYDLPEEFSYLQAQDLNKIGAMQDLLYGISKIVRPVSHEKRQASTSTSSNADILLKRGKVALQDASWDEAGMMFDRVLDIDSECPEAYLGKACVTLKYHDFSALAEDTRYHQKRNREQEIIRYPVALDDLNFKRAIRFADESLKNTLYDLVKQSQGLINKQYEADKEGIYKKGKSCLVGADTETSYKAAADCFKRIPGYRDADALYDKCVLEIERLQRIRDAEKRRQEEAEYSRQEEEKRKIRQQELEMQRKQERAQAKYQRKQERLSNYFKTRKRLGTITAVIAVLFYVPVWYLHFSGLINSGRINDLELITTLLAVSLVILSFSTSCFDEALGFLLFAGAIVIILHLAALLIYGKYYTSKPNFGIQIVILVVSAIVPNIIGWIIWKSWFKSINK